MRDISLINLEKKAKCWIYCFFKKDKDQFFPIYICIYLLEVKNFLLANVLNYIKTIRVKQDSRTSVCLVGAFLVLESAATVTIFC